MEEKLPETFDKDLANSNLFMVDESWNETISVSPLNIKTSQSQVKYGRESTPNRRMSNTRITPTLPSQNYMDYMMKYQHKIERSLDTHKFSGCNLEVRNQNKNIKANPLKTLYTHITEKHKNKKNVFTNIIEASHHRAGSLTYMLSRNKEDL